MDIPSCHALGPKGMVIVGGGTLQLTDLRRSKPCLAWCQVVQQRVGKQAVEVQGELEKGKQNRMTGGLDLTQDPSI